MLVVGGGQAGLAIAALLKQLQIDTLIDLNPTKISWTRGLKADLCRLKAASFDERRAVISTYRPYCKQWLYFDRQFNDMVLLTPRLFPTAAHKNIVIAAMGVGASKPFSALATDAMPSHDLIEKGQCFPLYYYELADSDGSLFTYENVTVTVTR